MLSGSLLYDIDSGVESVCNFFLSEWWMKYEWLHQSRQETSGCVAVMVMDENKLTLSMLRLLSAKDKDANIFENHLNPVMLVFIG